MRLMMAAKTIIRRYSDGSNDSLELNLSYESSSFDESIQDAIPLGTKPYLFEPEVSSEEESTASSPQKSTGEDSEWQGLSRPFNMVNTTGTGRYTFFLITKKYVPSI